MNSILPAENTQILNLEHLEVLATLADDNPSAFFDDLLSTFKECWVENLNEIQKACENNDDDSLKRAAHKINGSAANLGLPRLSELCRNVECHVGEGTFTDYATCPQAIEEEYKNSSKALDDYIAKL